MDTTYSEDIEEILRTRLYLHFMLLRLFHGLLDGRFLANLPLVARHFESREMLGSGECKNSGCD